MRSAVVGLMGCLVLALAGCSLHLAVSTDSNGPESSYSTVIRQSDFAAIRTLLAARARAVVAGNEAAFMATVDRSRAAFYASQRVMFENLQALPVTSMRYDVGSAGMTNAPGITGGPLLSPEIVEHVDFAGTDRLPVGNEVDETFVKLDGHWLLAADSTDSSQTAGDTARPWAGPPISVVTRGHLVVVADATLPGGARELADTVESDIHFDARILHVPFTDRLMVDATSSGSVTKFDNNETAGAVTFPVDAMRNFRPTALAGIRVKVNPRDIDYLNSDPVLLRHELTHFLMFRFSGHNPKWLTEGLAEYVAHQPAGLRSEAITAKGYARLMRRPRELILSSLFGEDPETDYPLAMATVTYLVQHGGIGKVKALMRGYASYDDEPYEDQHTAQVLRTVYDMTPGQVARGAFGLLVGLR
jgi:hypothetical protein